MSTTYARRQAAAAARCIQNEINGNQTTARAEARRIAWHTLRAVMLESFGYSDRKATATADYLKGRGSFQAACDAD